MEPLFPHPLPFAAAGRLLALLAGEEDRALTREALAVQAGLDPALATAVLDWLAELGLLDDSNRGSLRLGPAHRRAGRHGYPLLLHLEPDAALGSLFHALLAEHGYPSIGACDPLGALQAARSIEFDLALLAAPGQRADSFLTMHRGLLASLEPAPIVLYGLEDGGAWLPAGSRLVLLPGPPNPGDVLAMVQSLLPPSGRPP